LLSALPQNDLKNEKDIPSDQLMQRERSSLALMHNEPSNTTLATESAAKRTEDFELSMPLMI
jgi:hypothetical protein